MSAIALDYGKPIAWRKNNKWIKSKRQRFFIVPEDKGKWDID